MRNYILFATIVAVLTSCQFNRPEEKKADSIPGLLQGNVKEVIQTSGYTYLLMENEGIEFWIAGTKTDAKVGEIYYFKENMKMQNFQSKELNRTFDIIIFVQELSKDPESFKSPAKTMGNQETKAKIVKQNIKLVIPAGTTSIAELFSNKNKYKDNKITVRGVVTKYNEGIMNKNWIHLQDGTEQEGNFDLVVTSLIKCNVGDTLSLEGKVSLDKDFGYGYKYDVLVEDAVKK